jgi:hypothetical protein
MSRFMRKTEQNVSDAAEAPISKHQIPNNIEIQISNARPSPFPSPPRGEGGGEGGSDFGHCVIGQLFGIWDLCFWI